MTLDQLNAAFSGLAEAEAAFDDWRARFSAMTKDIAYRRGLVLVPCDVVEAADDPTVITVKTGPVELTPEAERLMRYVSDLTTQLVMLNHAHGRDILRCLEAAKANGPRFIAIRHLTDGEGDQ